MSLKVSRLSKLSVTHRLSFALVILALSACKPDGFINKVKYDGEKYINTCETFTNAVNQLSERNSGSNILRVSQYDNSDFTYFYLEEGQFEIKGDTLYFRLVKDLEYPQYLAKGVAVHVNATYQALPNLQGLSSPASGDLGTLVVDEAYYLANRRPFFMYKIPLGGQQLEGKQVSLSFAIAKYDKKGALKNYYCETNTQPIGVVQPACCGAQPWQPTALQTIVDMPALEVAPERFLYEGFTGTVDVMFDEASADVDDDSTFSVDAIQMFVDKYKKADYLPTYLSMTGYASPGGRESFNQTLSEKRAETVKAALEALNEEIANLEVTAVGKGEDWARVRLLTLVSSLNEDQQAEVLAIVDDTALTNDEKEAKLRKVDFWDTLVEEVLIKARHTFTFMDFDYEGAVKTLKRYTERLPLTSKQLETLATEPIEAKPYSEGMNPAAGLAHLDSILTQTATPNLYAMRATYYLAQNDVTNAISDLEKASRFRDGKAGAYNMAITGYKVLFADSYTFEEKKALYEELNQATAQDQTNRPLFFNRAIVMERLGLTSKALTEYQNLLEGYEATAAQLNNRGVARMKAYRITEAMADFNAALASDAELAEAYFNLAVASAYQGLTRQTLEYLDKAVARNTDYKGMIFNNPAFSVMSEDPRFDKYRD
ncbi:MAG: hypothetical protein D6722_13115 [Bacteroidetes bacterium]|nr:MAG: hypothetical protein D6722_13115 [Bacteroidota bacterium]